MRAGFKEPLEIPDLPSLPNYDDADFVQTKFLRVWDVERRRPR